MVRLLKIKMELCSVIGFISMLHLISLVAHGFVLLVGVGVKPPSLAGKTKPFRSRLETNLNVIKRQTAVYDGAEFISVVSFLKSQCSESFSNDSAVNLDEVKDLPPKRAGFITFITCPNPHDGASRVLGIPVEQQDRREIPSDAIFVQDGVYLYADTVVNIPKGVKDSDAISTAAAALCGVHCGGMMKDEHGNWNSLQKVCLLYVVVSQKWPKINEHIHF
jgi:hypothetical protein